MVQIPGERELLEKRLLEIEAQIAAVPDLDDTLAKRTRKLAELSR